MLRFSGPLDPSTLPELQKQKIDHPWRRKPLKFSASIAIASIVPISIVAWLFWTTEIPGAILMTVVYFPLQMIASAIAAFAIHALRIAWVGHRLARSAAAPGDGARVDAAD